MVLSTIMSMENIDNESVVCLKDHECLLPHSNTILTAIVHGVKKGSTNRYVGLAATNALLNSLEFTKANFEKEVRDGDPGKEKVGG